MTGSAEALEVEDGKTVVSRRVERKGREGKSAEEQLADVKKQLEAKDGENAQLRTQVVQATTDRNKLAATAAATTEARLTEREQALATNISGAKQRVATASAALKAAKDAGDGDAELAANEQLIDAKADLKLYEREKAEFDQAKPKLVEDLKEAAKPVEVPAAKSGVSASAQQWIDEHPRFNSDPEYKQAALDAHDLAVQKYKHAPDSPAYFAFLNKQLNAMFGDDHGQGEAMQRTPRKGRETDRTSEAASPGRGGDGSIQSRTHNLRLSYNQEGKPLVSGEIPAAWVEAAKWCGMTPVDYAVSKLEEEASGEPGYTVEGSRAVYR